MLLIIDTTFENRSAGNRNKFIDFKGNSYASPICQRSAGNTLARPFNAAISDLREKKAMPPICIK